MKTYGITFKPDGIQTKVAENLTVMEAAYRAGIILNNHCGAAGTCKKCRVEIAEEHRMVLACQHRIKRDMIIHIPESSGFFEQKILEQDFIKTGKTDPSVGKIHLEIKPPSLEDLRSDAQRLRDALKEKTKEAPISDSTRSEFTIGEALLSSLPDKLRQYEFDVTAVCRGQNIIELEQGDTTASLFGISVDVGTTTIVAHLMDLNQGRVAGTASETNPQIACGDDVISRIRYTENKVDGLKQLQGLIIDCLNKLIRHLCREASLAASQIYELTVTGNATMQHLLLGVPVAQIAQAPYVTSISDAVNQPASSLGMNILPQGNIYVMPGVAAHVGGDTVAVALATGMSQSEPVTLALDIGTNGEIVLGNRRRLLACSTAAGPAFEGARIQYGMRATAGAIERVCIDDDIILSVINDAQPAGICGSGLIDVIAELLKHGLIDDTGRLASRSNLSPNLNQNLVTRITKQEGMPVFVLAPANRTGDRRGIVLTQKDIREVQLAKAAIRAGIDILLKQLNIDISEVNRIYLAGAFGNYIRPESAQRMGLLPDVPRDKILPVGNATAAGVRQVLTSRGARQSAEKLARQIEYVELAGREDFQNLFTEHMYFAIS